MATPGIDSDYRPSRLLRNIRAEHLAGVEVDEREPEFLGAPFEATDDAAALLGTVTPAHARSREWLGGYLAGGTSPLSEWLVFEVLGLFTGALVSGLLAGRVRIGVDKGPRIGTGGRLAFAFIGGALMAIGAAFARGCTSGQALTGGALLNLGSWAFMLMVFGGAYALALVMRRQWR